MRLNSVGVAAIAISISGGAAIDAQHTAGGPSVPTRPAAADPNGRFELTIDSIMRGSDVVGYPPTGLRWSADSQHLHFEWRKPGEDEASTYEVGRSGGARRRLSKEEARNVPPSTGGRWDKARRRVLFVDGGDVVLVDATSRTRRLITRTTGAESNPRWARNDTHVTWVRDGNLYIAPVESGATTVLTQLTDVAPRRAEPRLTDSQRFIRDEEEALIDFVEKRRAQRKKTEEEQKKDRLPSFELHERQTASDLMLSADGTHAFILVNERPAVVKNTIVPNCVTDSGYTEDISSRANMGEAQDKRQLAVLNLETGKSVLADASFAGEKRRILKLFEENLRQRNGKVSN
jgi:hypothetical protein